MRRLVPALLLLLAACASAPSDGISGLSDRLFCGRSIPGGGEVSDAEVTAFVDEVVTPRFPEGATIWTAEGRWNGGSEKTLVIEVIHPFHIRYDRLMEEIAVEYRRRFRQEAVLRVTMPARAVLFR